MNAGQNNTSNPRKVANLLNRFRDPASREKAMAFYAKRAAAEKPAAAEAPQSQFAFAGAETAPAAPMPEPRKWAMPTKRDTMRFLFSPQIGLSLQGLTGALGIMVRTFALLLISVNLLPKDHPAAALRFAERYSLFGLLGEASRNLRFTRAGIPQLVVFGAICAFLFCAAAALLLFIARTAFGAAFAQTNSPGMGSNPAIFAASGDDVASKFINAIFDPSNASYIGGGLGQMLTIYSYAVLVLAGIILVFIIISAVMESARTGVPFGKQFNPVWAPIRLIVAIGLLVPLAGGLNSGQLIVVGLSKWGSEQASKVWTSFANQLEANGGAITSPPLADGQGRELVNQAVAISLRKNLMQIVADDIPEMRNAFTSQAHIYDVLDDGVILTQSATPPAGKKISAHLITWGYKNGSTIRDLNGGFQFHVKDFITASVGDDEKLVHNTASNILTAHEQSVMTMMNTNSEVDRLGQELARAAYIFYETGVDTLAPDFGQRLEKARQNFIDSRRAMITPIAAGMNSFGKDMKNVVKNAGWVGAANWLNRIAAANGQIMDAVTLAPAVVPGQPPSWLLDGYDDMVDIGEHYLEIKDPQQSVGAYASFQADNVKEIKDAFTDITAPSNNPIGKLASQGQFLMQQGIDIVSPELIFIGGANYEAKGGQISALNNIAAKTYDKALKMDQGKLGGMAVGALASTTGGNTDKDAIIKGLRQKFYPIGMAMITFGFLLGFMLPLIPFFRFFLGVLGWMILLFETVLAIPLLALAHLKTEGEGLMGPMAQQGYLMILGLILKPILMVFGLILGLIAFNAIVQLVNIVFLPTAVGVTGSDSSKVVSMGIYMLLYASFATVLANSAFKMIDIIPGQVMRWIGAQMDSKMDDASAVQSNAMGVVSGFGMLRAFSNKGGGAGMGAGAAGAAFKTPEVYKGGGAADANANADERMNWGARGAARNAWAEDRRGKPSGNAQKPSNVQGQNPSTKDV